MTTIALVTGANRGLGFATARRLAQDGMTVLLGGRDPGRAERAAAELRADGLDAHALALDVTDASSIAAAALLVRQRFGGLDVLVNNAGILPEATASGARDPLDVALFEQTFATNVFGAAAVTQAFLPLLAKSSAGRIVNVSSRMGSLTDQLDPDSPYHGLVLPAYQASKAALNGITIALGKRLADTPIRVASVCPGWVQTDLGGPDNRAAAPLTADEAATTVVAAARAGAGVAPARFTDAAGPVPW
ncbi:MAG TPA: SDR family NAD(P)-dependent oxidoreductase [Baekduia sp.]|nr:SDR family NAD(P)-dependent oxidoreductase [Baekduia sp.]